MLNIKTFKKLFRISIVLAAFVGVVGCVGAKDGISSGAKKKATITSAKKDVKNQENGLNFVRNGELIITLSEKSDVKVYGPTARVIQKALADSIAEKLKEFLGKNKYQGAVAKKISKLNVSSFISFGALVNGDVSLNDVFKIKVSLKNNGLDDSVNKALGLAFAGFLNELVRSGYFDKDGNLDLHKVLTNNKFKNNLHAKLKFYSENLKKEYENKKTAKEASKIDESKLSEKEVDRVVGLTEGLKLTFGSAPFEGKKDGVPKKAEEMTNLQKLLGEKNSN